MRRFSLLVGSLAVPLCAQVSLDESLTADFAEVNGSPNSDGSIENPWDITRA